MDKIQYIEPPNDRNMGKHATDTLKRNKSHFSLNDPVKRTSSDKRSIYSEKHGAIDC
jgi:hypothetical protein